jgi:hypothetical protein
MNDQNIISEQVPQEQENSSGKGKDGTVPQEIDRWNWGAFIATWIWAPFNGIYFPLVIFILTITFSSVAPFFLANLGIVLLLSLASGLLNLTYFIVCIVAGVKGNQWAWRAKHWDSIEAFRKTQRRWIIISLIVLLISLIVIMGVTALQIRQNPNQTLDQGQVKQQIVQNALNQMISGQLGPQVVQTVENALMSYSGRCNMIRYEYEAVQNLNANLYNCNQPYDLFPHVTGTTPAERWQALNQILAAAQPYAVDPSDPTHQRVFRESLVLPSQNQDSLNMDYQWFGDSSTPPFYLYWTDPATGVRRTWYAGEP